MKRGLCAMLMGLQAISCLKVNLAFNPQSLSSVEPSAPIAAQLLFFTFGSKSTISIHENVFEIFVRKTPDIMFWLQRVFLFVCLFVCLFLSVLCISWNFQHFLNLGRGVNKAPLAKFSFWVIFFQLSGVGGYCYWWQQWRQGWYQDNHRFSSSETISGASSNDSISGVASVGFQCAN